MAVIDGKEVMRSYTPTSSTNTTGHFDLLIKSYPNGTLSKWFAGLNVNDTANIRGPKGNFAYTANMSTHIGMIAGGTGITPMLQIIRAILENPLDKTQISLIFANVTEEDILLRDELDALCTKNAQLSILYVLNQPPSNWVGGVGFVSAEVIRERCPAPSSDIKILLCGPPPMIKAMQTICENLGYDKAKALSKLEDQIFKF